LLALACVVVALQAAPAHASSDKSEAAQQLRFGVAMALKGSWHEAAFRFERSIKADPGNPLAQNNLGVAMESIGEFDKAQAAYKKAAELDPRNAKIRENKDRLEAYLRSRTTPATPAPSALPGAPAKTAPAPGEPAPQAPSSADPNAPPPADPNAAPPPPTSGAPIGGAK
jgi:tetratricopeptide (TPR) repeat protein